MKELQPGQPENVAGGLAPGDGESQIAPEPAPPAPSVVTDYNPPIQSQ